MQKALLLTLALFFITFSTNAQDDVLFSVGDTKVKKSEFEAIYKKIISITKPITAVNHWKII